MRYRAAPTSPDRIRVPAPAPQRASMRRIGMIKAIAIAAAIALTVYDALVSYWGFDSMTLPLQAPAVLALLILIVQLGSGAIQQLGMDPFRGVGGSRALDFVWSWVLGGVYLIDVASNAVAFGAGPWLSPAAIASSPGQAIAQGGSRMMLALLLTFGDEILLRLVDRLVVGSRANAAAAKKSEIDAAAYQRYLSGYRARAMEQADRAGAAASVDFDWLRQGGGDDANY